MSDNADSTSKRSLNENIDDSAQINSQSQTSFEMPRIQHPSEDCYKMNHAERGFAYIFNHIENGIDRDRIFKTLTTLRFEIQIYEQLEYRDIVNALKSISSMKYDDVDCLVVVVITHGRLDYIEAADREYYPDLFWTSFKGDLCPGLIGKPKLFFIDACRGKLVDQGKEVRIEFDGGETEDRNVSTLTIPIMADFLIVFSTQPGFYGFEDAGIGSWFIYALCLELESRYKNYDFLSILTFVNRRVAFDNQADNPRSPIHGGKQISSIVSSLTRYLYFNPKLNTIV